MEWDDWVQVHCNAQVVWGYEKSGKIFPKGISMCTNIMCCEGTTILLEKNCDSLQCVRSKKLTMCKTNSLTIPNTAIIWLSKRSDLDKQTNTECTLRTSIVSLLIRRNRNYSAAVNCVRFNCMWLLTVDSCSSVAGRWDNWQVTSVHQSARRRRWVEDRRRVPWQTRVNCKRRHTAGMACDKVDGAVVRSPVRDVRSGATCGR